jgi:hypothetical protein
LDSLGRGVLAAPLTAGQHPSEWETSAAENLRRARAGVLTCPRASISHVSSAIAMGLPTLGDLERSCLTVPAGTALRRLAHVHLHRATLSPDDLVQVGDDVVTSPQRTIMDLARERGVLSGVVAADHALHHGLVTADELASAFELCRGWPGRKAARITLLCADGAAESPLESISRLKMAASGLPAPRLQVDICDEDGVFLGRSDFYWDEFGVVGEADGDLKYDGRFGDAQEIVAQERRRQALFERAGLLVVRWGWGDLWSFENVVARLRTAFARGAAPGSPARRWGLPLHP